MSLWDHPGFFGITSQGVVAIHADWPMYPEEHGADLALLWLTAFPKGTIFRPIDDIDRCILFVAMPPVRRDPFDEQNFHVAIWHEDLVTLATQEFIADVDVGFDDDDESWIIASESGMSVSREGRRRVSDLTLPSLELLESLGERVLHLLKLSYYDTAVREACVSIESKIKVWLGSRNWGQKLLSEFSSQLKNDPRLHNPDVRVIRAEVRLAFKFIRNEFAHNQVMLDAAECKAKLFRLARLRRVIDFVAV